MKCLGLNRNFRRCGRKNENIRGLFCSDHSRQPLAWLAFLVFTVFGGTASILSYIRPNQPIVNQTAPRLAETSLGQSAPSSTVQPSPQSLATPAVRGPEKHRLKQEPSSRVQRAKALFEQGNYQEALRECDAELRVNPNNNEALILRRRIARTIKILNQ